MSQNVLDRQYDIKKKNLIPLSLSLSLSPCVLNFDVKGQIVNPDGWTNFNSPIRSLQLSEFNLMTGRSRGRVTEAYLKGVQKNSIFLVARPLRGLVH